MKTCSEIPKASSGGYKHNKYRAMFVGIAPANEPEFIMAVLVDEPTANGYFGGAVAAPIFKEVLENVLRIRNIPSDESEMFPAVKKSLSAEPSDSV
nr:penicillin-binding transpeptidase domain-containing protein [Pseudomonas lundensis]